MTRFWRWFTGGTVRYDPTLGDSRAAAVRAALERGDWQQAEQIIAREPIGPDREFLITAAVEWKRPLRCISTWVEARPSDSLPLLMAGVQKLYQAKQGINRSKAGSERATREYFHQILAAVAEFTEAETAGPDDPFVYAMQLFGRAYVGEQLDELEACLAEADRRAPFHLNAHLAMTKALSPGFLGDRQKMIEFAQRISSNAPAGHAVHCVVAMALVQWFRSVALTEGEKKAYVSLRNPDLANALRSAAERSVYAPHRWCFAEEMIARNLFAGAMWLMGHYPQAAEQFDVLARRATPEPWFYFGPTPVLGLRRAEAECRSKIRPAGLARTISIPRY
jgi:hypothetical protein